MVAVLLSRFLFAEPLLAIQWLSISLATAAVLTIGLGVAPWISLVLTITFGLYGLVKKGLDLGPTVSVATEVAIVAPFAIALLAWRLASGGGAFGASALDSLLLIISGPLTALTLILFTMAACRIAMSTMGVMQYINPTLQFLCAVALFGETFTQWHQAAFALIWTAVALYSISAIRQDRAAKSAISASGASASNNIARKDGSANP